MPTDETAAFSAEELMSGLPARRASTLSGVGFRTGLALVVLFGVINMITAAALAEAVARSGTTRFGIGFLGQRVQEYLGSAGKAWAHRMTPEGHSEGLSAGVELESDTAREEFELRPPGGSRLIRVNQPPRRVQVTFAGAPLAGSNGHGSD